MKKPLLTLAAFVATCAAHAEPVTYAIDPSHTFVSYEVNHMNTSTSRGRFDRKEGSVTIDRQAGTGKIDVTIDTRSIDTGVPALDTEMKGADFFNAARFATARFVGDKVSFDGDRVSAVSGNLTMLGKTLPVTLKATHFNCYTNPMLKREVCGGDFDTPLARSQWGMSYGVQYGVPDSIRLLIQVEAVKQ